jgi:hypothetical protein
MAAGLRKWKKHHHKEPKIDDDGMAYELFGEAFALGDDTFASIDTVSRIVERGKSFVAKGYIVAKAAATDDEADAMFSDAITDVSVTGADLTLTWTKDITIVSDDYSLDVSITKFFAIDVPFWNGDTTIAVSQDGEIDIDGRLPRFAKKFIERKFDNVLEFSGNTATVDFDATAQGENTFVDVDVNVLALEGELSEAAIIVTGAVA